MHAIASMQTSDSVPDDCSWDAAAAAVDAGQVRFSGGPRGMRASGGAGEAPLRRAAAACDEMTVQV